MIFSNQKRDRLLYYSLFFVALTIVILIYIQWHFVINKVLEWQKLFHSLLSVHINTVSQDPAYHGAMLVALSFAYGVFHAIGPGHGKAIIVTYLGSHKESLKKGAIISLLAALFQATVAILLVVILSKLLSIQFSDINRYADDVTLVSYLLVMMLGGLLFFAAFLKQLKIIQKKSAQQIHHTHHDHSCCGGHHVDEKYLHGSWLESIGVIFSMGMRPCTGAILVLIYAHLVGTFYYGILAALVMGLGTGLAVAFLALTTQLVRTWFEKLAEEDENKLSKMFSFNFGLWLRMAGGVVIFFLGFGLFQVAIQVSSGSHPLL